MDSSKSSNILAANHNREMTWLSPKNLDSLVLRTLESLQICILKYHTNKVKLVVER